MISTAIIQALNFHAICCLHVNAGEYRPCPVAVGNFSPPAHYRVPELMNAFVNEVNRHLETADALTLAAYCLWRLNHIHPFINGNGRTARALCYYVVCVKVRWSTPRRAHITRVDSAEPRRVCRVAPIHRYGFQGTSGPRLERPSPVRAAVAERTDRVGSDVNLRLATTELPSNRNCHALLERPTPTTPERPTGW